MVENTKIFNIAEITSELSEIARDLDRQAEDVGDLRNVAVCDVESMAGNACEELEDLAIRIRNIETDLDNNFKPDSDEFIKEYIKNEVYLAKNDFVNEFKTKVDSLIYEIKKVLTEETEKLMKSEINEKDLSDLIEIRKNK